MDLYFLLDTETGTHSDFTYFEQLSEAAKKIGINPQLEPIYSVYSQYRFSWFDLVVGLVFLAVPLVGFLRLASEVFRLGNSAKQQVV